MNEDIKFIEHIEQDATFTQKICQQIRNTNLSNTNLLQEMQQGIYLLTIKKTSDSLHLKKLADRTQYAILPTRDQEGVFVKISFNHLRNLCHDQLPASWILSAANKENLVACQLYFFYHLNYVLEALTDRLAHTPLRLKEILSNRTVIFADGEFDYPVSLSRLAALAIWHDHALSVAIDNEIQRVSAKFLLFSELFASLQNTFAANDWTITDGQMRFTHLGITKPFDYASLLDDIQHAGLENRAQEYLSNFHASDLDSSNFFPTVAVRSPIHLKARPWALSSQRNGYAIVAAVESLGKQTAIRAIPKNGADAFLLWLKRTERHLFRHSYKARAVFVSPEHSGIFSLVGEQIATIGLFPSLIKGVFEKLSIIAPKSVRVIAHSEDVLTIAHDTASWVEINTASQKATELFRLVSTDGADPLSLFEQLVLPEVGAGNFQIKTVPDTFFELIDAAENHKNSMPRGHNHYLLGLAYECLHEWGLAAAEFQKALRLDNNDPDIYHNLGCALMEIGQVEQAMPFLKRAFDMMPEDAEVANNWGRINMECGELTDAIKAFEHAVRLSPGTADYLKNLGDGYLLAKRPDDALDILNKAVRSDPSFALAHASLASLHLAVGDDDLAKKHALIAYRENPADSNIANLLWRLTLQKK
ncbi:MAG TPA: tetratricopeptide repeat protein [Myxococcota bacterium]|nr:tetratricopeptide repeat protein [Myxococcota bacterium]